MSSSDNHPDSPADQHEEQQQQQQQQTPTQTEQNRKEIKTFHCRFCSHLLLASTRPILSADTPLARRGGGASDRALILDIPSRTRNTTSTTTSTVPVGRGAGSSDDTAMTETDNATQAVQSAREEEKEKEAHYTIPLATLLPDAKPVIIRRDDGFEKRLLFKCGRCRVVVGYEIVPKSLPPPTEDDDDEKVMYLLPGSLVGTEDLQGEEGSAVERNNVLKQMEAEWAQWVTV